MRLAQLRFCHFLKPADDIGMIGFFFQHGLGCRPKFPTNPAEYGGGACLPGQLYGRGKILYHEVQGETRVEAPGKNKAFKLFFSAC